MTLDRITHNLLDPVTHGFFGRKGGASSGVYAGLNCGVGSFDQHDIVAINRARVAVAMGVEPDHLMGVHQVHSADVVSVDQPSPDRPRADALVTKTPGIALSVLTADCQPVLFAETQAGVIGAAHAGWQGAVDGVLGATVDAMCNLGAARDNIIAVIGPCISQRAYEVGPEFLERFIDADPDNARYFANGNDGKYQFDLPGFGLGCLRAAGIKQAEWTRHCTYSDEVRFYSYRRSVHHKEPDYGRLIASITL